MLVVSNSTTMISFGIISYLSWLHNLYDKVVVPQEVYEEVVIRGDGMPGAAEMKRAVDDGRILVQSIGDVAGCRKLMSGYGLDKGEAETITLAVELNADVVVIDEDLAWRVAQTLDAGFATVCLPFVLDRAQELGYVNSAFNALRDVVQTAKYNLAKAPFDHWKRCHGLLK